MTREDHLLIRDGVPAEEPVTDAIAGPTVVAGYLSQVYFERKIRL